jgi:hypothetical protein
MPAKIASSMAGSPFFVPGILMRRFGRLTRANRSSEVEVERIADGALGIDDPAVHLASGQADEFRRQVGNQRFEAQALFEFRTPTGVSDVHRGVSYRGFAIA